MQAYQHYLQAMGIVNWQCRQAQATEAASLELVSIYAYRLINPAQQVCGLLLAQADLKDEAEQQLVAAIAKATQLQCQGGFVQSVRLTELLDSSSRVLIVMGEKLVQQITEQEHQLGARTVIASYAPQQLLQDRELKAKTWQDLQRAMQLMQGP